jgi:hypothetical protein
MAFGTHWEWRVFGDLPEDARTRLDALPAKFPSAQVLTDEYLYVPGCPLNVKLRRGDLKLKRFLEAGDGLECWLEDENENYPFPLTPALGAQVAAELGVDWDPTSDEKPLTRVDLLERLLGHADGVRVLAVEKSRVQRLWSGESADDLVTVEVAEITAPERVTSIGVEHHRRERALEAVRALELPSALQRLNYLEALAIWARDETIV